MTELQSKPSKTDGKLLIRRELSSLFNADSNQQYERKDNVRIFDVQGRENEQNYQTVIKLAKKLGCQVSTAVISIWHRALSRSVKPGQERPIIAKACLKANANWPDD